ncbi:MAG: hypothetical protein FJ278_11095, partial [Planctomycetes bacterium]|nr:hypothetical protein [Planctomycetota bacterium]
MAKEAEQGERRCPGESHPVNISICRARQKRRYPKCAICPYATPGEASAKVAAEAQAPPADAMQIFKSYDIRGKVPGQLDEVM